MFVRTEMRVRRIIVMGTPVTISLPGVDSRATSTVRHSDPFSVPKVNSLSWYSLPPSSRTSLP